MTPQDSKTNARRIAFGWFTALALVALAITACLRWLDYPTAKYFMRGHEHGWIGKFFGGRPLVAYETIVAGTLAIIRLVKGRLPPLGKVVIIASAASIITYAVNALLLKPIFGRLPPGEVDFANISSIFHYFQGTDGSSFPSGHMALAGSFLAVFYRVYPQLRYVIATCVLVGCALLVLGDWHYISDVIAGTFVGMTVGLLVGELWIRHSSEHG